MPSEKTENGSLPHKRWRDRGRGYGALLSSVLFMACHAGVGGRGAPSHYAQSFDSASLSCRNHPGLCASLVGEESVVPQAAQRLAEFGASATAVAVVLDAEHKKSIEQKLTECANKAREQVLLQHMDGRSPTPNECHEEKEFGGRVRTRAMFFGEEMHKVAFQCAEVELSRLRPGGFSLEPRYRYNKQTRQRELISQEKEEALLEEGCYSELRGTIKPDVVIHSGNPLLPQAVYDFKFPCVNSDNDHWCRYSHGPHRGRSQKTVYEEIPGAQASQLLPWLGAIP